MTLERSMTVRRLLLPALLIGLVACMGARTVRAEGKPPVVPVHASLAPLRPWLRHADWTVRSIAAYELHRRSASGVVYLATRMLATEKHPYAAACALGALRGRPRRDLVMEGGCDLVAALVRLSRHEHPTVRAYALEILRAIPPVRLGEDLVLYEGWWKRGRAALGREQRQMLEETAALAKKKKDDEAKTSSSVEPGAKQEHFYERLELMRKHGLELCVVLDHTGSMGPWIGAAKRRAVHLLRRLRSFIPQFRAGLVTYDDAPRLRIALTQDEEALEKAFRKVGAGGGGDYEEGVDKGIRLALKQSRMAWSQRAYRVVVVVGDAPPHEGDVPRLLRTLRKAREDILYDREVVVHTVSTTPMPVLHFPQIALAGGGQHVTLTDAGRLVEELVLLTFGGADRERIRAWMSVIDALREAEQKKRRPKKRRAKK